MKKRELPSDKDIIAKELRNLAERIEAGDLEAYKIASKLFSKPKKKREKPVSPIDAYRILREKGEQGLRQALENLELTELRNVLLAYNLDRQQLARKWKNEDRLRQFILERLVAHFKSGNVFLQP
jgi:hypothetical protein